MSAVRRRFSANVRRRRLALGMTQQDLADRCGLSRISISNIEAGRQATTVDSLVAIAAALRLRSLDDLLPLRPPVTIGGLIDWTLLADD